MKAIPWLPTSAKHYGQKVTRLSDFENTVVWCHLIINYFVSLPLSPLPSPSPATQHHVSPPFVSQPSLVQPSPSSILAQVWSETR